jgi:holo-[acyl-carrier protein] synthase
MSSPRLIDLPPGGILLGLGADVIEVERIRGIFERQGDRFLDRIYTEEERAYCMGMKVPFPHLAARFAAKEAVSKAFTTGIGAELGWKSISIYHGSRREPRVRLDVKGEELLKQLGASHVLVTLSHTQISAMAVAALIRS